MKALIWCFSWLELNCIQFNLPERKLCWKNALNLSSSRRSFNMNSLLHVVHFSTRKYIIYWLINGSLHLNCHKSLSLSESSDSLVDLCVQRSIKKQMLQGFNFSQESTHKFKPGQFTVSETFGVCYWTG